jgi:cellulase/cellobiase CelA1
VCGGGGADAVRGALGAPSIAGYESAGYESWAAAFACGLGNRQVVVIVEPDALAEKTCLNAQQAARDGAIGYAGSAVRRADPNARVYFDAGNSAWNTPLVQAQRLQEADVAASASGISSNVSNIRSTADEVSYERDPRPSRRRVPAPAAKADAGTRHVYCVTTASLSFLSCPR